MPEILIGKRNKALVIEETLRAYESLYPEKYRWLLEEMTKLRQVGTVGYTDAQGRETTVTMKFPSEIFLFLQWVLPGFGQDSDDIKLLTSIAKNLDAHVPLRKGQSLFVTLDLKKKIEEQENAANVQEQPLAETEDVGGDAQGTCPDTPDAISVEGDDADDRSAPRSTGAIEGTYAPDA